MSIPKHIILGAIGIGCSIGSGIVAMLTYEDKRTEMNRQVNTAVDQRFMELMDHYANSAQNSEE